jgi:malonate transporter and related proteins
MLDILAITGPIYITILIGYLTTRQGIFAKADMRVFGKFVFNLALPAMLFNAVSQRKISEIFNGTYVLVYLLGSLLTLLLGWLWCRRFAKMDSLSSTFHVMGMTCSNSGFVGFPILVLIMAPVAGVALAMNMIVENFVIIPLLLALAERSQNKSRHWLRAVGDAFVKLITNPIVIGLVMGSIVALSGWQLPPAVSRVINLFALSSSALSLFVIGGTLVGLPLKGLSQHVFPIIVGKLLLHPLAMFAVMACLTWVGLPPLDNSMRVAALLLAAMPMMGTYIVFAQLYGKEDISAAALLLTTATSFFTLSALLWLLKPTLS